MFFSVDFTEIVTYPKKKNPKELLIGLMADSHGQPAPIVTAIEYLSQRGCGRIYHLGDVCDSAHAETAQACLRPLLAHGVTIIKGNNDHTLVANHAGQESASVAEKVLDTLQDLPLRMEHGNAILTHSLPFTREFGLVSMVRSMELAEARRFFDTTSHPILFRGHSHTPEIIWRTGDQIHFERISGGERIALENRMPCVITCGALTRGFCMVWRPAQNMIECIVLPVEP